jgi:hypothetical protein
MKMSIVKIQVWWGSIMTRVNRRLMRLCIQIVTYTLVKALRDKVVRFIIHSRSKEEDGKESGPSWQTANSWRSRHPEKKAGRK